MNSAPPLTSPPRTSPSAPDAPPGQRRRTRAPGRLTWRDARGALRFVAVVTRDVSDVDTYVTCQAPATIPLYRLVHIQIDRPARGTPGLPDALKRGRVLAAVFRVGPYRTDTGTPEGYGLRLLVEPATAAVRAPAGGTAALR
ncbi:MAG: hypothetical protein FJW23_03450 [Acidimicrobiia bacterium]|nr:hypothetical protein [Acidimicrobiia bacterium]